MSETFGLSQLERFAEPNPQELLQMLRDGRGRPSAIRWLAQFYQQSKQPAGQGVGFSGYNPMTGFTP